MPLTIKDAWLPATLTASPMTDEEFANLVSKHPDLSFEMTAEGELVIMPPNKSKTGARNANISADLCVWARTDGRGSVFDSSAGFVLPNGARFSPDASWVSRRRIAELDEYSQANYFHLCPDFVIELRSESDRLPALRSKMLEYMENGAQLGWLIDSERRAVEICRPGRAPEVREDATRVEGEGPVAGFVLDLQPVWKPW